MTPCPYYANPLTTPQVIRRTYTRVCIGETLGETPFVHLLLRELMWQFVGSNRGARIERISTLDFPPTGSSTSFESKSCKVKSNFPRQILFPPASLNIIEKHPGRRLKFRPDPLQLTIRDISRSIVVRNIQRRIENVQATPHSRARDHRLATCTNGNLLPRNLDIPLLREHRFADSRESEIPIIRKEDSIARNQVKLQIVRVSE